jgi:hypothetical protein
MSRLTVHCRFPQGLQIRVDQRLKTTTATQSAASLADAPARRRAPQAMLPGPSRRITVEPLTVPVPAPCIPAPTPPRVEPHEEPQPLREPTPTT